MKGYHLLLYCFLHSVICIANGGPIDISSTYSTGSPVFLKNGDAEVRNEDIQLKLFHDRVHVRVDYLLNCDDVMSSATNDKIVYGFPIDFSCNVYDSPNLNCWDSSYVRNIHFVLGGIELRVMEQEDLGITQNPVVLVTYDDQVSGGKVDCIRKWYFTEFVLPASGTIHLVVEYDYKWTYEDWAFSKSFFPIFSERCFVYDFSAASNWRNFDDTYLSVRIDRSELTHPTNQYKCNYERNVADDNLEVQMVKFENVQFDQLEPLKIVLSDEDVRLSEVINEYRIPASKIAVTQDGNARKNYPSQLAFDGNFSTAWCTAGESRDTIEFLLKDLALGAILLINGYTKSESTFIENNRIKKLRVESTVPVYNMEEESMVDFFEVELPDEPFQMVDLSGIYDVAELLIDLGDAGQRKEHKIRFIIKEVYKGSKYNDTCVSEIYFVGWNPANFEE